LDLGLAALLAALGFVAASCSGLLGIGGGLIVVPLLLYVPPLLGYPAFDANTAAGIGVAQVAVASASGTVANFRRRLIYERLAITIIGAMATAAMLSGWASQFVAPSALLALFAVMASLGAIAMLLPTASREPKPERSSFNPLVALMCGLIAGTVIGLVGSGAFLLIPLQVYLLGISVRTAMATGLAAGFPTALAALSGKALGGQVAWLPATVVCFLAVPGAQLGTYLATRLPVRALRRAYALTILLIAATLWYDVLS
jgi:uncharacterized membrane protein YfcA